MSGVEKLHRSLSGGSSGSKPSNKIEVEIEVEIEAEIEWRAVSVSISWVGCNTSSENASEMYYMWWLTATSSITSGEITANPWGSNADKEIFTVVRRVLDSPHDESYQPRMVCSFWATTCRKRRLLKVSIGCR